MNKTHKHIIITNAILIIALLVFTACSKPFVQEPSLFWDFTQTQEIIQAKDIHTIAIDAGHGGMDTGAGGIIEEVYVTEKTADYLFDYLKSDPHYNPIKTRENGEDLSNTDRAQNAMNANSHLLISIHANKDSHSSSFGFECYAIPPGRDLHEESLLFAQNIAARMQEAGNRLRGETGVRYMYYINHNKKIVDSTDEQIRDNQSFGILEKASCPAVLVEQCFLSNHSDVDSWASDEGCKKSAFAYYLAICDYFGTEPLNDADFA